MHGGSLYLCRTEHSEEESTDDRFRDGDEDGSELAHTGQDDHQHTADLNHGSAAHLSRGKGFV